MGNVLTLIMAKQRISVSLDQDLIKKIDYLLENKYDGLPSRSAIIERYLREPKSVIEDYQQAREQVMEGRVLT